MLPTPKKGSLVHTNDLISLFVSTVTDVYLVKSELVNYLPLMTGIASNSELKLVILDCGNSITAQLLRLNMLLATLKQTRLTHQMQSVKLIDLDVYLGRDIKGDRSNKTDVLLLIHLSMIESVEVTSFLLLQKLASKLHHKWVYHLLEKNLLDAVQNKKELDQLLDTYLPG